MNTLHRLLLPIVAALALPACEMLSPAQVAGVNGVVAAGCVLVEAVPLPPELAPFAGLEPVACAGLQQLLAAELTRVAPPTAGVAASAVVSSPLPRRAVFSGGKLVGFARVAPTGSM